MRTSILLAIALLAACGNDAPRPPARGGGAQAAAKGGAAGKNAKDSKNKLQPRMHAEDKVLCPVPDKPTGPECKPDTPTCDVGTYCLQVAANKFSCEPCPERDSIRHEFKDRDFVSDASADHGRDPFQSFVIIPRDLFKTQEKPTEVGPCTRADQFVAPNYSYQELKLVGIVAQGTQRKVLMMAGNKGQIIKRGDCVGKEKAVVKDIGTGYVTFLINPNADNENAPKRPPEEHSVQLHPNGLEMEVTQPDLGPAPASGPTVAPPTVPPPSNIAPPAPSAAPTVAPPKP
ncbi:MAG: hypothetical protein ACM31C_12480 [Acidobacteriota bacterium]